MATLPAAGYLENAARTNAEMKAAFEAIRDIMAENIGGEAGAELTIASGSVTPAEGVGGGIFRIDTEGNAASDSLDTIAQTNTRDGQVLALRAENAARVVTVTHAAGGTGQILLYDGVSFTFASTSAVLFLRRSGTDWVELFRFVPIEDLTALTTPDPADMLRVWDDSANVEKRITAANLVAGSLGAALVPIETLTASASATLDFDAGINSTYSHYVLVCKGLVPATDDVQLLARIATSGPSWQAGAGAYQWGGYLTGIGGTVAGDGSGSGGPTTAMCINGSATTKIGNAAGEGIDAVIEFFAPSTTAQRKRFSWRGAFTAASGNDATFAGGGSYGSTSAIVGVRLLFSSGNIASGEATLYGVRK